jgi:heat-inducible transcriptional repressor
MRILNPEISEFRKKRILYATIYHYIKTNRPVSSNVIAKDYNLGISSATVRIILSELVKEGFLKHTHVSSGCVPTDKGYRYFVDSLTTLHKLAYEERRKVVEELRKHIKEMDDLFIHTSHLLALVSNYAGFVLAPNLLKEKIEYLQLVKIKDDELLLIFVTYSGLVKHQIFKLGIPISDSLVKDISDLMNEKFRNLTLNELKLRLLEIFDEIKQNQMIVSKIVNNIYEQLNYEQEKRIMLDGVSNIIPAMTNLEYNKVYNALQLIEQKKRLADLFEKELELLNNTKISIGKENPYPEFEEMSLIRTSYKIDGTPIGVLGIIGPKRMEYDKMISIVNFIGDMVNKIINEYFKKPKIINK